MEAITQMRALSQAVSERLRGNPTQQQQAARMAQDATSVGRTLAEGDYPKACASYAAIAQQYGVDLDAYAASLAPLQGNAGGGCDVTQASRRITDAYQLFNASVDTSGLSTPQIQTLHKEFSASIGKATLQVQTDPERACQMVDDTLTEFGIEPST
ncbi:MAG: hypothetical protein AAGA91_18720 [Pseudomonadota bacterium]